METWWWQDSHAGEVGSYRTYEEWKRLDLATVLDDPRCSYRTYEEWKRRSSFARAYIQTPSFLPYL